METIGFKKFIALGIIILLITFFAGFIVGGYVTIKAVASVASGFIDEEMVTKAIYQYRNDIGGSFPPKI